ncbi:esterase [Pantoea alhagi]|uniref:esterase n=1 Tax=Pantoea alhagi TaxID=1891675 RepID=UPI00202B532E|nr:esterase [Pantoea alhagi]URQ60407.1 esterase [Pantoea alhagi]
MHSERIMTAMTQEKITTGRAIDIVTESFNGIECLHAAPAGQRATALPVVIFWHGYLSSKEVYAWAAVALAQAGFRVIMPDADQHGARYGGNSAYRLAHFWDILRSSIDELPQLEAALRTQGLIAEGRFGVAGASMGGMTALGAMARYPHINRVACLMGSGYFMSLSQRLFPPLQAETPEEQAERARLLAPLAGYDPSRQLERLADRPLLLWHGEADDVVPVAETQRLVQALTSAQLDQQLSWLTEPGVGHKITPQALEALVSFFASL